MCHPEVPTGVTPPEVARIEVAVPVEDTEMPALLTRPEGISAPAVLIVCDVFGRSPFYEQLAARLSTAGFFALVPDFFFREGELAERTRETAMARRLLLDERRTLRDLLSAVEFLKGSEGVIGERTGTVGFCMGGTLVLDMAAERSDLATVCYYGFPAGFPGEKSAPAPLGVADRITGPILGFWGDQDAAVGMDNVEKLAAALDERKVPFDYTIYPGLGHGFMARSGLEEGGEAYDEACASWTRTLEFYRRHLA